MELQNNMDCIKSGCHDGSPKVKPKPVELRLLAGCGHKLRPLCVDETRAKLKH